MGKIAGPLFLLAIGLAGGLIAKAIGTPIPFMLGSLITVGTFATLATSPRLKGLSFPMPVREGFVAVIGTMIGGTFTIDGLKDFQSAWLSAIAILIFIALCLAMNYQIFRKLGGYGKATAFYSSMPGGLIDSVTIGESAGGDARILTIQHFVRIAIIVTIVPLGYWAWTGDAVGSASGMTLDVNHVTAGLTDYFIIATAALLGFFGGRVLRIPAYIIVGPMVAAALVHLTGLTQAQLPDWMLDLAQLVVGTAFGSRFAGLNRQMLLRALLLGLVTSTAMLAVGIVIAAGLTGPLGQSLHVMILCFAPGGVSEMGLIALSLNANPIFVTAHHLLRILATVIVAGLSSKWMKE